MIHGFNIEAKGTAFTAVSTSATNRTEKEMAAEEIQRSDQNAKTANISYETKVELSNSSLVVFNDPTNDKLAVVSLKNSTLSMLKDHFGEDDFYKRDDGLVRLDNKAEAYVSGWFGDIAYKRDFLGADSNNDGQLSENEYGNTYNGFGIHGELDYNNTISEKITGTYGKVNTATNFQTYREDNRPTSLDDELDKTLSINKDMNDTISLKEAYNADVTGNYEEVIYRHAKNEIPQALKDAMWDEKLRKLEEENSKKANAIEKVLSGDMELSVLEDTEKLLLKDVLSIENKDDLKLALNKEFNELEIIKKYERHMDNEKD